MTEKWDDLIRKFKSLLDDGIITEEEFNKKKKELLS
ncbi:SHOCT domain-containing protein [Oceanobacillus sp. FSL K6-3682]